MISIVLVSHSAKLAEGVYDLANQMTQGQVSIATAGGIDDPDAPLGTDPTKVLAAIEAVYSEEGVLVLIDLGSALLSAEMALEFLSPEQQANIYLCAAPLVEGAMAAAVQASVGGTIQQVMAEAMNALAAKAEHLAPAQSAPAEAAVSTPPAPDALELRLIVPNRLGLHARPAALFVRTAAQHQAEIWVSKGERIANAKSINQVATLGVRYRDEILITAAGPDAAKALVALKTLAGQNFGDSIDEIVPVTPVQAAVTPLPATAPGELVGIAASPGIAIGPAFIYQPTLPPVVKRTVKDIAAQWAKLQTAVDAALLEIRTLEVRMTRQVNAADAAIFGAHQLFLEDPILLETTKGYIFEQQINAEAAWEQAIEDMADTFHQLDDEYLRARAADILDVGQRVLRHLLGVEAPSLNFSRPSILIATDLTPSDTARLDPAKVLGICTEVGTATSHSAILARALGIPAIVGLNQPVSGLVNDHTIALDGATGRLWLNPTADQLAQLETQRADWLARQHQAKATGRKPAVTQDGHSLEIAANIGGPHDAGVALEYGAEGVGLFRTEFLYMDREQAPTEEEQLAAYRQVAQAMGTRPVIIRTLDVGGDKPLPYLDLGREDNPFLGWRGIRFCLEHPEILKPQLRAVLRASAGHNLKLMFPMVGTLVEWQAARQMLAEVQAELREAKIAFDAQMEVGIMIEVPSAVAVADQLAAEVDFFSIGTNDLTQYVMAADRGNARVATLANALQPAVLRMIKQTVQAANAAGIWVGMCGELAGNPLAAPLLVGLGLTELSMSAPNIPHVKAAIRRLTLPEAEQIAQEVLKLKSADAVKDYLVAAQKI